MHLEGHNCSVGRFRKEFTCLSPIYTLHQKDEKLKKESKKKKASGDKKRTLLHVDSTRSYQIILTRIGNEEYIFFPSLLFS